MYYSQRNKAVRILKERFDSVQELTPKDALSAEQQLDRLSGLMSYRKCAVLVALRYNDRDPNAHSWSVLLTLRTRNLRSHAGLTCLPGGKLDDGEDVIQAALREAKEEVGLDSTDLEVIGTLPPMLSKGNYVVWPVVAVFKEDSPVLVANADEVEHMFFMPFEKFLSSEDHRYFYAKTGHMRFYLHMFDYHDESDGHIFTIWGLTARVLIIAAAVSLDRSPDFVLDHSEKIDDLTVLYGYHGAMSNVAQSKL